MPADYPYYRLSSYYFFYFAALGVFLPFWPVYLEDELGFSAVQIGQLIALFMLSKVIAPIAWGWLIDHYGHRLSFIRVAGILTVLCFLGIYWNQSYWMVASVMLLAGFFWNASLPQFEALTLNYLGKQMERYSIIRVWGSWGFIIMVASIPFYLEQVGSLSDIPSFILLLFIVLGLSTFLVKDRPHHDQSLTATSLSLWSIVKQPMVFALLLACALQQASHGVYYTFFSIYLEDHGYSKVYIGWMWALAVFAEVILFMFMHRIMKRWNACTLFNIAMLLTGIRWIMLAYWVDNQAMLWASQVLHAATYGVFHASAIHLIHELFPSRLQGRGQALYAGISFGVGGALGAILSGYAWESLGATQTFMLAALTMGITMWITWQFVQPHHKQQAIAKQNTENEHV